MRAAASAHQPVPEGGGIVSALNLKIKRILAESGQSSRAAARIEELVREREAAERDAALARIAELEAEVVRVAEKFVVEEGEAWRCKHEQYQRAERAEARIAEAAKLHYEEDHECVECSFESMPDVGFRGVSVPWPCPTAVSLGLNEGGER